MIVEGWGVLAEKGNTGIVYLSASLSRSGKQVIDLTHHLLTVAFFMFIQSSWNGIEESDKTTKPARSERKG